MSRPPCAAKVPPRGRAWRRALVSHGGFGNGHKGCSGLAPPSSSRSGQRLSLTRSTWARFFWPSRARSPSSRCGYRLAYRARATPRGGAGRICVKETIRPDSISDGFGRGAQRDRPVDPKPVDSASDGPSRSFVVPSLISDAVDAYVVRRLNARLQFLLMQRRADAPFGSSWQASHPRIRPEQTAISAAERALAETARLVART